MMSDGAEPPSPELVAALRRKINHQADRIDDLQDQLERLEHRVRDLERQRDRQVLDAASTEGAEP